MEDEISLNEQMKDLDFYKMIQKERSITSKHTIDEYRMDIAKRLIDESIKKQAIKVVDLIESQLEENQKLEDAEDDEYEGEVDYVSVEDYVESVENESNLGEVKQNIEDGEMEQASPDPLQPNINVEEPKVYEMPEYEMTEKEQAAMDEMVEFNKNNSLFKDLESANLEHKRASFKESKYLNTAKQGIKILKKDIDTKVKEIDVEKLDEQIQTFGIVILGILNGIRSFLGKTAIALYKIPAKRAQKKNLDYSLKEANGAFKGKSINELGEEGTKMFKIEWGPKIVLLLSAILIYNEFWKMGSITLAIGLIYYLVTYFSYDYGGSKMLNILAGYMDSQGIRMKDAYYTNMIVLYRYFNEYQSDMNVSIDESGPIEITEDPELGSILKFYVNEDKNTVISSITDHRLNYFKVVPFLDSYNLKAKLQEKRQVAVMLDQILLMAIKKDDDIAQLYSQKEEYWDYFVELKGLAEQKQALENARLENLEREKELAKAIKTVLDKGINEKAANIITTIYDNRREWKFNVWNLNEKSIEGNQNYAKLKCIFNQNGNIASVNALKQQLESKFRSGILIKQLQDRGSFDLYVLFNAELSKEALTVEDLKVYNEKDEIYIGNSLTGKLTAKWNSAANHILVGGTSGSGKSVQILSLLSQLTWLKSYDYTTMFITSSSKIGDFVPFAAKGALVSSGVEKQEQVFAYILELLTKREKIFYSEGVDSIMKYNKKYPNNPMKQIVLVADEWENSRGTLDAKLAKRLEGLLVQILNIARSSGCIVIVGAQSILKGDIGTVVSKMFVKYSGSNDKPILRTIDPEIANYYGSLDREPQGVFFYSSSNTPAQQESLFFGDTNYTLIQTPYLKEIGSEILDTKLPQLYGAELEIEIFNGEINEQEVITSNLDVEEVEKAEAEFKL